MPKRSNKPIINFHVPRFQQISESHCGPATIQMLLGNLDVDLSQEAIAEAGGASSRIEMYGMRVDQMAIAVEKLAPGYRFWWKREASLQDIITLIGEYNHPVGVEWQGLFEGGEEDEEEESETGDEDYGHYSIVTHFNLQTQQLIIADPYKDYISQDRVFSFEEFEERWWDTNEAANSTRLVMDRHMLFIITPEDEVFPQELGLQTGPPSYYLPPVNYPNARKNDRSTKNRRP